MKTLEQIPGSDREKSYLTIPSHLKNQAGSYENMKIEVDEEKKPKAVAFFDIDGTLAHLKFIHGKTIQVLYPEVEAKFLQETFYEGFRLGTSVREFHRMALIFRRGETQYQDPSVYAKEFSDETGYVIDNPNHYDHAEAMEDVLAYSKGAGEAADNIQKENPRLFEEAKIQPIFHLAKLYKRLGLPMVGMTANGRDFTLAAAKYLGLSELFIDIATDEDMKGGGKENAMTFLIEKLEKSGLTIPKEKLIIVGDSPKGDVGSGAKPRMTEAGYKSQGILVLESQEDLAKMQEQIAKDPALQEIVKKVDTSALVIEAVPVNMNGDPILSSRYREQFLTKLSS